MELTLIYGLWSIDVTEVSGGGRRSRNFICTLILIIIYCNDGRTVPESVRELWVRDLTWRVIATIAYGVWHPE